MDKIGWIIGIISCIVAVMFICWNYRRTKATMDTLEKMLDTAIKGEFSEKSFDESRMSALETELAQYLGASAISAKRVAEEKDKIKTLIADISHQTKTPIANLVLYSELLQEEDLSETARDNVQALHAQAEKLHFLIDALVKLSRLENGIISLTPRQEMLFPMLKSVEEQFRRKAESKGLTLKLGETEISAKFDSKWTKEALENIVDNAIKYTQNGAITISVTAYEMFVRIDVADSGMGIEEEEQAKIFARFYRSQAVREQEGVGIGLYLAREIITNEGGYIKVTSERGKGSLFSVFLPR